MTYDEAKALEPILEKVVTSLDYAYSNIDATGRDARYLLNMIDEAHDRFLHELEMVGTIANSRPIADREESPVCCRARCCPFVKIEK